MNDLIFVALSSFAVDNRRPLLQLEFFGIPVPHSPDREENHDG